MDTVTQPLLGSASKEVVEAPVLAVLPGAPRVGAAFLFGNRRRATIAVAVLLLSIGFAAQAGDSSGEATIDRAALEKEVFRRINAHRRESGRALFVYDEAVATIARGHSQAIAQGRSGFGHGQFKARAAEVAARVELAGMAENVSKHRRSANFAEAAVVQWLASPVHRANIDGDYSLTGVGTARGEDGTVYFTQLFVRVR